MTIEANARGASPGRRDLRNRHLAGAVAVAGRAAARAAGGASGAVLPRPAAHARRSRCASRRASVRLHVHPDLSGAAGAAGDHADRHASGVPARQRQLAHRRHLQPDAAHGGDPGGEAPAGEPAAIRCGRAARPPTRRFRSPCSACSKGSPRNALGGQVLPAGTLGQRPGRSRSATSARWPSTRRSVTRSCAPIRTAGARACSSTKVSPPTSTSCSPQESQALLAFLFAHAGRPELTVRWHWRVDDVAFWDNRVTQHYAIADYLPERRTMHRATVNGDKPF